VVAPVAHSSRHSWHEARANHAHGQVIVGPVGGAGGKDGRPGRIERAVSMWCAILRPNSVRVA
jgi:hypothetical protein